MAPRARSVSRRELFTHGARALLGTPLILEGLGITRFLPEFAAKNVNAFERVLALGEDSRFLIPNALAGGLALARFGMAEAQQLQEDWSVITIKIFDQVDVGLMLALGKLNAAGEVETAALAGATHPTLNPARVGIADGVMSSAAELEKPIAYLHGAGGGKDARKLCTDPRLRKLRFNDWFGQMLATGVSDVNYALPAGSTGPLPESVAVQVALNLRRPQQAVNHQLNCVFMDEQADLNGFLEQEGVVFSPLGYTAFMMGDAYDANAFAEDSNHVYRRLIGTRANASVATGLSVGAYTTNFDRLIRRPSFVDLTAGKDNLLLSLDRLVEADPKKRKEFIERRVALVDSLSSLSDLGAFESAKVSAEDRTLRYAVQGAGRFIRNEVPESTEASKDFLAQCLFTSRTLGFEGAPLRNFNLFLNIADVDGSGLLSVKNGGAPKPRSYNYVEAMRQLAVGLNILIKASAGKKVLINVITDATRRADMNDGDAGLALLFGPRSSGMLDDALYASEVAISGEYKPQTSENDNDRNLAHYAKFPLPWAGENADAFSGVASLSNWQYGIAAFLADRTGHSETAAKLISPVTLKRKA